MSFCVLDDFFRFSKKIGFWGILGPPSYGIGATIRIGREMLCLLYAGFFSSFFFVIKKIYSLVALTLVTKTIRYGPPGES